MPVRTVAQRPNTCCSSGTAFKNDGVRQHRQAWMAFHKQRPQAEATVATPMSWPGCARPPAGLRTLENDYNRRAISTAQIAVQRRISHNDKLPPINNHERTKHHQHGSRHINTKQSQKNTTQNNGFSARKWANHRSTQMPDDRLITREKEMPFAGNSQDFKRAFPVPRQKRRERVVSLNEKEAAAMRRLQGIYANTKEKNLRAERIQQTLKALQDKTLHTEVSESLREYQKRAEVDKGNRKELKRVRDSYYKDKKRRTSRSHISLNALESPQVSRLAYGLPEEGKEFEDNHLVHKTEVKLQKIWQKAMRRAVVIDKFIQHTVSNTETELHLPKIKVKRSPPLKKLQHHADPESHSNQTDYMDQMDVNVAMTELDALSSVGSESEDDLTESDEED